MKFGRSYVLNVTANGTSLAISYPITIDINVEHVLDASATEANFGLYNLNYNHRKYISFNQAIHQYDYRVTLNAGYASQVGGTAAPIASLPQIFSGFGKIAFTERTKSDVITRINALDMGDALNSGPPAYIDGTPGGSCIVKAGTDFATVVKTVMGKMVTATNGLQVGVVNIAEDKTPSPASRPWTFVGNGWSCLQNLARMAGGSDVYIENGVINMLSQNATITTANAVGTISPSTGLLDTPKYEGLHVVCHIVFEPNLRLSQIIYLQSTVNSWINGTYKVIGFSHHGRIGDTISGDMITEVSLLNTENPKYAPWP